MWTVVVARKITIGYDDAMMVYDMQRTDLYFYYHLKCFAESSFAAPILFHMHNGWSTIQLQSPLRSRKG